METSPKKINGGFGNTKAREGYHREHIVGFSLLPIPRPLTLNSLPTANQEVKWLSKVFETLAAWFRSTYFSYIYQHIIIWDKAPSQVLSLRCSFSKNFLSQILWANQNRLFSRETGKMKRIVDFLPGVLGWRLT